jgi:hypothetical protein
VRRLVAATTLLLLLCGCDSGTDADPPADPPADGRSSHDRQRPRDVDRDPSALPSAPPLTTTFRPARRARELAARIEVAEDLVRTPRTEEDVLEAAAFESQLLYRQLARKPAWERTVRAAVPPRYRAVVGLHVNARHSLRSVLTTLSDELPAWEILDPAPTADLLRFYREGERVHGVAWELLAAINLVETGFGRIHGLSTAGARGPMQFIPSTWAAYGEGDIEDPHDAILGAANYLAANDGGTGTVTGAGVENALFRYNNHQGYVDGIMAYAAIIERDPRALAGLVNWQIVYLSTIGDLWLPVGYRETSPVPVREYVREHPERHLGTATG